MNRSHEPEPDENQYFFKSHTDIEFMSKTDIV